MNRIGMRAIKSAIVIILAYLIYILLITIDKFAFKDRIISDWYIPFLAGLIAFISIANSKSKQKKETFEKLYIYTAILIFSFLLMLLYMLITKKSWPELSILDPVILIVPSVFTCIGVILIVYFFVLLKKKSEIIQGITIYLILISIRFFDMDFRQAFIASFISIVSGVFLAYFVNSFHLPRKKQKEYLFIYGPDGIYANDNDVFDDYVKYELSELIENDASITFFTTRTPATFLPLIDNMKLKLPIICMNGAALYDTSTKHYLKTYPIKEKVANEVRIFLAENGIVPFINIIEDNLQHIYTESVSNIGELIYADTRRNSAYSNFLVAKAPSRDVLYFMVVAPKNKVRDIIYLLQKTPFYSQLLCQEYSYYEKMGEVEGYSYLKIFSKDIVKLSVLDELDSKKKKVAISTTKNDKILYDNSDLIVTSMKADIDVRNKANIVIKSKRSHALIRILKRLYYHKSSY